MITRDTIYVGGAWVPSTGTGTLTVVNATTEEAMGTVPDGTPEDVDAAVAAAQAAFPGWAATSADERAELCTRIAEGIGTRMDEIATLVSQEVGMVKPLSTFIQAGLPYSSFASVAAVVEAFAFEEEVGNSLVVREPVGVVGCITPWNYPLHQIAAKVAFALGAGCTVVVKPSEVAPLTAFVLAEIVHGVGLPAGVFNLVVGTGDVVGEAVAGHPGVDMVSFTGSTRAGKRVSVVASDTVERVALELGGKSANVVLDDADLGKAVKVGLANAWINGGQTCTAWTRMIVPATRHDEIVEQLVAAAAKYTVGDPTDEGTRIGPMSSATQQQRVNGYIERGTADGATVAMGGVTPPEGLETGAYVRPTIFANVDPDAVIAQEEIFGPVLSVIPYADEDQAVEIANSTVYGLAGAVFGEQEHAMAVARRMRTGQVDVNGGAFNLAAPFGGYKQSGNGRELGRFGLEEFVETKSIQR